MASKQLPTRERRPSTGAPLVDIQGAVGPAGVSRPKHRRTFTGFGAGEIKHVEGLWWHFLLVAHCLFLLSPSIELYSSAAWTRRCRPIDPSMWMDGSLDRARILHPHRTAGEGKLAQSGGAHRATKTTALDDLICYPPASTPYA